MNNLLRGLIAGYGAKKLGGGCFGTILVFILIWVALGQCSAGPIEQEKENQAQRFHTTPASLQDTVLLAA